MVEWPPHRAQYTCARSNTPSRFRYHRSTPKVETRPAGPVFEFDLRLEKHHFAVARRDTLAMLPKPRASRICPYFVCIHITSLSRFRRPCTGPSVFKAPAPEEAAEKSACPTGPIFGEHSAWDTCSNGKIIETGDPAAHQPYSNSFSEFKLLM